jgi:hypothetical protein
MTDKPDYIRISAGPPPDPPALVRAIHSDLIHSMPVKDLLSWLGQPTPENALSNSIHTEVFHAF